MIKFKELKPIVDEVIEKLNAITEKLKNCSNTTDEYKVIDVINQINEKIHQINSIYYNVYAHPEFKYIYGECGNFDYTDYVKLMHDCVDRYEVIFQKINKNEKTNDQNNNKQTLNNSGFGLEK